jgi:hypothetical protein
MGRQISMEAGLEAFRKKCADLLEANVLLEAQLAEVEKENEQLRAQIAPGPEPTPMPSAE